MKFTRSITEITEGFSGRLSELVKSHPRDSQLNQTDVGKLFGVSGPMVSKWRTGKSMPAMANACAIAKRYEVTVEWLLTGRGDKYTGGSGYPDALSILTELSPENQSRVMDSARAFQALEKQSDQ
tara:strand:+ start:390 stop:764 length:375 start_codon:yes stop_codon:yes gene_type:complete